METKEYIITAESSQELIEEAVKALYTNGVDSTSSFMAISPMSLDDDQNSITRIITMNGVTVTVTNDAYLAFADAYFTNKAQADADYWNEIATDKFEAELKMKEMWENNGAEWPLEINDYRNKLTA